MGTHFSTNGDFGAFVVDTGKSVFSSRGPINTGPLDVKIDGTRIAIEDSAIPEMFAAIASTALWVIDNSFHRQAFRAKMILSWISKSLAPLADLFPALPDTYDPNSYKTEAEMVSNIFFFNCMGVDDASGVFRLDNDRLDLNWPNKLIADNPVFAKIENLLKELATAMGGRYVPFPYGGDSQIAGSTPIHLCSIAPTSFDGVVDEFGQVFDGSKPPGSTDTLPGL